MYVKLLNDINIQRQPEQKGAVKQVETALANWLIVYGFAEEAKKPKKRHKAKRKKDD